MMNNAEIGKAMVIKLDPVLPEYPTFKEGVRRAPMRELTLNKREIKLAVANALRYVPEELHEQLAPEFLDELLTRGRIYGYRFMPKERIYGKPIDEYKGKCVEGKAFQVMIDNNLDHEVALYPYELVTYGETGQVCQNWMQYQLIKKYLEELLTVLNLQERRNHLPSQLSGGQQQRVAIGRALITRPSLILADEPTGNLDTQNSSEVIALLKEASKKYEQTIIMITHNRSIAQTADRVLQVSDGVLTDFGRCRE